MYRQSQKIVKRQYLLQTSSQYGELRPTDGWDRFGGLGHPSKFQRVSRLAFVTAATSLIGGQPNCARCLAVSWAGTSCIHFSGALALWRNFATCKIHFASKSCVLQVLLYYQRYCTALQQRGQPNCGIEQRTPPIFGRAALTLAIGLHSSFVLIPENFMLCYDCFSWIWTS